MQGQRQIQGLGQVQGAVRGGWGHQQQEGWREAPAFGYQEQEEQEEQEEEELVEDNEVEHNDLPYRQQRNKVRDFWEQVIANTESSHLEWYNIWLHNQAMPKFDMQKKLYFYMKYVNIFN